MATKKNKFVSEQFGSHHAAAYIHDVKNVLSILMSKAEANSDRETMHLLMDADYKLNHLLILYKSEVDMFTVNIEPVTPSFLLQNIAANFQPYTLKKIEVEPCDDSQIAYLDKGLIELCIGNALHNAERYARSTIHLSSREVDGMTVIRVRDDGPGYSNEMLSSLGKKAVDSTSSSGLGIYLAEQIAKNHVNRDVHGYLNIFNDDGAVLDMYLP